MDFNLSSASNFLGDLGQAPSLSEPQFPHLYDIRVRKRGGKGGASENLPDCDIRPGSPHHLQPLRHLQPGCSAAGVVQGGGQERREEAPGNLGPALPSPAPSMGQLRAVRMCGARAVLAGL